MASNTTVNSGLAAANGNGSLKTRSAVAVKALPENRLDPIALKALEVLKKGSEQEVVDFLDFLRKNGLEARFTEVTRLINKNSRLSEAERQVLKYKLAKIAKESLEELGTGTSEATRIETAIEDLSTSITNKTIIDYDRLLEIAQTLKDSSETANMISTAICELGSAVEKSYAAGNENVAKTLTSLQALAVNMGDWMKTATEALATLNKTVEKLPTTIANLINTCRGENQ